MSKQCKSRVGTVVIGAALAPPPAAWGEVRPGSPPPPAFKSGDQLSLPILQDIAATLNRIDGRLARLEIVFKELSTPRPSATRNN